MNDGLQRLRSRLASLPEVLRWAAALPGPAFGPTPFRRILTTGLGSSEAHARYLASLLCSELGLAARFVPTAALARPPHATVSEDLLVVFSQGLSPNARVALEHAPAYAHCLLVTALGDGFAFADAGAEAEAGIEVDPERDAALQRARDAGVHCLPLGVGRERGLLAIVKESSGSTAG